jgi:hypothetical protein
MTPQTFRRWLAERGCSFEEHPHERGEGLPSVTVRREGRRAVLSDSTSRQDLDEREVRRIVDELGLDWRELPGPANRS